MSSLLATRWKTRSWWTALLICQASIVDAVSEINSITRDECTKLGGTIEMPSSEKNFLGSTYVCQSNGLAPVAPIDDGSNSFVVDVSTVCCGVQTINNDPTDLPPPNAQSDLPGITEAECIDIGGDLVGDIGNGDIWRDDYRCQINGLAPTAKIVFGPSEPIPVEGEVCCGGTLPNIMDDLNPQAGDPAGGLAGNTTTGPTSGAEQYLGGFESVLTVLFALAVFVL